MVMAALSGAMFGSTSDTMASSPWKPIPLWGGGFMQNVVLCPSEPSVLYAYADVSGPWRSDDRGASWYPLAQNLTLSQRNRRACLVRGLSVDPRNADSFVLVGGSSQSTTWPAGMYVSRDGGRTFRQTGFAFFHGQGTALRPYGQVLARHPSCPDLLIAGEDVNGLFMSTDNGESWRSVGCGLDRHWFTDLRWDLTDKDRIFACAPSPTASVPSGFFMSGDNGRTWERLSDESPLEIFQLSGDDRLFGAFGPKGIRMSEDHGRTWIDFSQGLELCAKANPEKLDRGNYHAAAVGLDFLLIGDGDGNLYRRTPFESSWQPVMCELFEPGFPAEEAYLVKREAWSRRVLARGLKPETLVSLVVDPRDQAHWFAVDWLVIWETHDSGRTWKSAVRGIAPLVPFTVACDPFSADNVIAGYADMGLQVSNDGGKSYAMPAFGFWCSSASWSHVVPGLALATGGKSSITFSRTMDGGRTWQEISLSGLPLLSVGARAVFTVAAHPSADRFYAVVSGTVGQGAGGVYVSDDHGDVWNWIGDGLPSGAELFREAEFGSGSEPELVVSSDGSLLALSSKTGMTYCRPAASSSWMESSGAGRVASGATADPHVPGRFLMCGDSSLLETTDGGISFHPLAGVRGQFHNVAFDVAECGLVAAIEDDRLLLSTDGGHSFSVLDGELNLPCGAARRIGLDRRRLFFRTEGNGIYVRYLDSRNF